ncbi:hypothetical protein [Fulvivirga sp.]|jgi:hypothetical protein|uniref:hypothetical protein n=1 Tax=Fulvivirga sp. TaxID=1931237 RepID=UPI0032ECA480
MENLTKKQAIVQSLESMNSREQEQLIGFIKEMLYEPERDIDYTKFKENALKEIQQALSKGQAI